MTAHSPATLREPSAHPLAPLRAAMRPLLPGLILALLANLYGFGIGIAFGINEEKMKASLKADGQAVLQTAYAGDPTKLTPVLDKSWTYLKRAHLHANGLGTTSVALIVVLLLLPGGAWLKGATAVALGLGAIGYAHFWMLAGLRAPALGSTGAAKETLTWLAWPSSTLLVVGLLTVIILALSAAFRRTNT